MSWLETSAYLPFERAKGIRLPPTMATLRGLVVTLCHSRLLWCPMARKAALASIVTRE